MVYRIYVEKQKEFRQEAKHVLNELKQYLGLKNISNLRVVNRYDVEGIDSDDFDSAVKTVFSEPQVDDAFNSFIIPTNVKAFAVQALPGQFDQRADSAAQCIQLMTAGERPIVRYAKIYIIEGEISEQNLEDIKKYLINPVESREVSFELPKTLKLSLNNPDDIQVLEGFREMNEEALKQLCNEKALAMDIDDLLFVKAHFIKEGRDPSLTELRVMDTYWSDHCRHTTFLTALKNVEIDDEQIKKTYDEYIDLRNSLNRKGDPTLMEAATIGTKALKRDGALPHLDESEEINACTVRIKADTPDGDKDWLLLFKNETHNHPTEIEPFGGAATCIGGAIRDPLSARSYVYASMRVTGAADPTLPLSQTIPGKLSQRKICTGAASGFSSYGNQIGLATGTVREIYHPGYAAKRLETGAVLGAAPLGHVRRERPLPGDVVILLGGRTGRDGIGGATGSSMAHTVQSVDECASQVQKGNAPEERKLQRLFRNEKATLLIKRCNDFGAGGVSVAIGELADGLEIDLDKVPRKYEGLDGTELAISESQERMAVVVAPEDVEEFNKYATEENLEATQVAVITEQKRMVMRWRGKVVVDLDRDFLSSNGAPKQIDVHITKSKDWQRKENKPFDEALLSFASSLNGCSQRGLIERFDSTIGAGSVLLPLGGKNQTTAPCSMVHLLPVEGGTKTASYMAYGFNPEISSKSPYHGAYLAVVEAITNLIATGAANEHIYLSHQEFFPKPMKDPKRWGMPLASLLGALRAQLELSAAAIGGKDSMSGSFEDIDVPPTLISFAVTWGDSQNTVSPEFKKQGSKVICLKPELGNDGLPKAESLKALYNVTTSMLGSKQAISACAVGDGGIAAAILRMAMGNGIGFEFENIPSEELFEYNYGAILLELADDEYLPSYNYQIIGTTKGNSIKYANYDIELNNVLEAYNNKLEGVYTVKTNETEIVKTVKPMNLPTLKGPSYVKPRVLIPAFPGTNCELDTARAFERAGAIADVFIIKNLSPQDVVDSVNEMAMRIKNAQLILIPGGFSGGDEPEGSAKLITSFFRSQKIADAVHELLDVRKGLVGGICNGFQALIKLGLLPYGKISGNVQGDPTLTFNTIGRHQSRIVSVKTCSTLSPWFAKNPLRSINYVPISHGEGRFVCTPEMIENFANNGQIASQYVDMDGNPTMNVDFNPSGSYYAVEAITSPDGRVMGRMGHSERMLSNLYKNLPGVYDDPLFISAVNYFK